eukprot:SAG31_NODE_2674_length_5267_cov_13.467492_7_plen_278_part_00
MKRIDRALDDCSRPISLLISKIQNALSCYVGETITDIERIDPGMTELIKGSIRVDRDGNGTTATSTRSNRVLWDASSSQAAGILRAEANHTATFDSAAAAAIATFYSAIMMSQPYAREIPGAVTSYLDHDPISPAAARLRLFIRHGFVPDLRAVAALLRTHAAATMELPPTAWLKSKFPAESWASIPSTLSACVQVVRQYIIPIYHINISYQYIIPIYHTNISYQYIIPIYHTNISYQYIISYINISHLFLLLDDPGGAVGRDPCAERSGTPEFSKT